jgi:hypothetical protein
MNTKVASKFQLNSAAILLTGIATFGLVGNSHAGCVDTNGAAGSRAAPRLENAVYHPTSANSGRLVLTGEDHPSIVGLWKFEMISKSTANNKNPMPDGTLIDFGTAAWHADGTEFQTSGIRNPSDGDVCQGVWQQVDDSTFVLNHYALAWTNGVYTGPANIRARVTVDPTGHHYNGNFATVVYLATPVAGHEFDEGTVLASITGTFTATRVTLQ